MLTEPSPLSFVLLIGVSYVLGCVVSGYYIARAIDGRDIRAVGSGNAGTRNVAREYGRSAAAVTLLIDSTKAVVAVMLAWRLVTAEWSALLAVVFVIIGHVWPAQLQLRGGKGAAPAAGGFVAADSIAALAALVVGLIAYSITRRFTTSGLIAVAAGPVAMTLLGRPAPAIILATLASALLMVVHHPRIDARRTTRLTTGSS